MNEKPAGPENTEFFNSQLSLSNISILRILFNVIVFLSIIGSILLIYHKSNDLIYNDNFVQIKSLQSYNSYSFNTLEHFAIIDSNKGDTIVQISDRQYITAKETGKINLPTLAIPIWLIIYFIISIVASFILLIALIEIFAETITKRRH